MRRSALKVGLLGLLYVAVGILLTACGLMPPSAPEPMEPPPDPEIIAPLGRPPAPPPPVYVPTRDFLTSGSDPNPNYDVHGYVLFTRRPANNATWHRYMAACDAYIAALEPTSSVPTDPSYKPMPTYWLLSAGLSQLMCEDLIRDYDYARARILATQADKVGVYGPVLVAWSQNTTRKDQLILDLSNFNDEDMGRAFGIWMNQLARNPNLWQGGFDLVRIREEVRSLLQKYGEEILTLITRPA